VILIFFYAFYLITGKEGKTGTGIGREVQGKGYSDWK